MPNPAGNPANLIPWKPGQSGNPEGRPRKPLTVSDELRAVLQGTELVGQLVPSGMTVAQFLAQAIVAHAIQGNAAFAAMVLDRTEGKAVPEYSPEADAPAVTPAALASLTTEDLDALESIARRLAEGAGGAAEGGPGGEGPP